MRHKETAGVDIRIAPEIDSDGAFRPAASETVLCTFQGASIAFSRKKAIEIPDSASPRQRARLEKKIERQQWEHLGTLKRARFIATSLRLIWIAKHRGQVWIGFSPKGLVKAAVKSAASSVMAAGKWDIGQVLLTMVGGTAADGDKRLVFTFADSETKFRVDVEKITGARGNMVEIHKRSARLIRRAYEQYLPNQQEAIEALRQHEAHEDPGHRKGSFASYSTPYVCRAPLLPDEGIETSAPSTPRPSVASSRTTNARSETNDTGRARKSRRAEKRRQATSQARRLRRWIKVLSPPAVMAVAVLRWVSTYGISGRNAEYLTTSTLCVVALGLLTGLIVSWVLSGIWIRRGALSVVGYAMLGFAAWQEWGEPWRAPLRWTYSLSLQVRGTPLHLTYLLQAMPGLTFALFMMAVAWGLLMRKSD